MIQTALFYNFDETRLRKAKFALMPLKITVKAVKKEDFSQPIGSLAGVKGIEPVDDKYTGEGFSDEMIVMNNFTSEKIDLLIRALIKHGVGRVALKAVITPVNKTWDSVELHNAVKADYLEAKKQG